MSNFTLMVIAEFAVVFLASVSAAQPVEQVADLYRTTRERGLDELLVAISTSDNGNYDVVCISGMQPSGFEVSSRFQQIIHDPRVLKIYELMDAMPKEAASKLISSSFDKNLRRLKAVAAKGKGDSRLSYSLHVLLFLSLQIEGSKKFNQHFDEWYTWFVERMAAKLQPDLKGPVPDEIQRQSFAANSPELLMYLNLILLDQVRSGNVGDDTEFARMLKKAGFRGSLTDLSRKLAVRPFDSKIDSGEVEPLFEVPVFPNWGGLDVLDTEQRLRVFSNAQRLIDPNKGWIRLSESVVVNLVSLGGRVDLDDFRNWLKAKRSKSQMGTRLELTGGDLPKLLAQAWYPETPPTKVDLCRAIDRIYREIPESQKSDWDLGFEQARKWLAKIPENGIKVEKRQSWQWPEADAENATSSGKKATDSVGSPEAAPRIRLTIIKSEQNALAGKMPQKNIEKENEKNDKDK